jgi:GT2 family glycosyltransferase
LIRPFRFLARIYARYGAAGVFDFLRWAIRTRVEKLRIRLENHFQRHTYQKWIAGSEKVDLGTTVAPAQPSILASFLLLLTSPEGQEDPQIQRTVQSLQAQTNPNWECFLIGAPAGFPGPESTVKIDPDPRIRSLPGNSILDRDTALVQALPFTHGKWLIWIRPGETFAGWLLGNLPAGESEIVYWDEDLQEKELRHSPFLKPAWSPELWLSIDLLHCSAFRSDYVRDRIGELPPAALLTSFLVLHAPRIEHIPKVLSHCPFSAWADSTAAAEHQRHVLSFLELKGRGGAKASLNPDGSCRVDWPEGNGKISIVIPSKNNSALLRGCIESIFQYSQDADYEIILVDDASTEAEALSYYGELQASGRPVREVQGRSPFNFSAACNLGARAAQGAYLLFLNNDTQVLDPTWLHELRAFASWEEIGVVGAKLLFPDRTLQHAGIVMGIEGHASHVFLGAPEHIATPFGSPGWYRNYSAVTGACLMMRKALFDSIGGFDERYILVFSDVELCLRVLEQGYRVVYNPEVRLLHHEGKSRGKLIPHPDILLGYERFAEGVQSGDPFYNPGLSYAWRIPSLKRPWEQNRLERLQKIMRYL